MEIDFNELIPITDTSSVGEVRRTALLGAQRLGFNETRAAEYALLATEVSRNVLIHGGGGQIFLTCFQGDPSPTARIVAMDQGPGIANVALAIRDGYSTAGTMGGGMGAMKRIATFFEVFTNPKGTVVLLDLAKTAGRHSSEVQFAGITVPYPGERVCGDAWICHQSPERTHVLVVDGLGHGREASEAAKQASSTFRSHLQSSPGEILGYMHDALKSTRGAVAAVAEIRPRERTVFYAGIGNIAAVLSAGGNSKNLVSHNGTLGIVTSRIQEFQADWPMDAILILHSDGLQSRWDLSSYAGLMTRHPATVGGVLFRDFRRQRDDATVVVLKACG